MIRSSIIYNYNYKNIFFFSKSMSCEKSLMLSYSNFNKSAPPHLSHLGFVEGLSYHLSYHLLQHHNESERPSTDFLISWITELGQIYFLPTIGGLFRGWPRLGVLTSWIQLDSVAGSDNYRTEEKDILKPFHKQYVIKRYNTERNPGLHCSFS